MSTAELKSNLHQLVDGITDDSILQAVFVLLTRNQEKEKNDWFDELPKNVKIRLLESMNQAENGQTIPHDEVMKRFSEKHPQLRFK
jgi:hypothetical protein